MASQVQIYNQALVIIGALPVDSVDDTDANVTRLNVFWETVRDRLVGCHNWSWAVKQATLVKSATIPTFGYDYGYALPADFLRAVKLSANADGFDWEIKEALLQIDLDSDDGDDYAVELEYVAQVTDTTKFPADFTTALSYALAAELATITKGKDGFSIRTNLLEVSQLYLRAAVGADHLNENVTIDGADADDSTFVSVRD